MLFWIFLLWLLLEQKVFIAILGWCTEKNLKKINISERVKWILTSDLLGEMSKHSSNFKPCNRIGKAGERISGINKSITCVESFSGAVTTGSVGNTVKERLWHNGTKTFGLGCTRTWLATWTTVVVTSTAKTKLTTAQVRGTAAVLGLDGFGVET